MTTERPSPGGPGHPSTAPGHFPLALLLVVIGALYLLTAARAVQGGDNGEFATLYAVGGVAHPSGFPLYLLWLRLLSWLPAASPAHGAALATAALALAAAWGVHAAAREWGADRFGALLACAAYALSPVTWDLGTQAEVFTVNALLATLLIAVAAPSGLLRGSRRALAVGLLGGLGLSNNLTIVLVGPVALAAAATAVVEAERRGRAAGALALGLLFGLTPYLWLMIAARGFGPDALVWGDVTTLAGLAHHVLRRDYGSFSLTAEGSAASVTTALRSLAWHVTTDLLVLPALVGLVAIPSLALRALRASRRAEAAAFSGLFVSLVLAGPVVAAAANVVPSGPGLAVVRRLYLLPELLLAVGFALGTTEALRRVALRPAVKVVLVAAVATASILRGLPAVERERGATLEAYLFDTLRALPEGAVLLGSGDTRVFGFAYVQRALGVRRDVLYVSPILLHYDWYRARISSELGADLDPPVSGSVDTVALAERILGGGRPLFLADELGFAILRRFPSFPIGTVLRVLPPGAPVPGPDVLEAANAELFERLSGTSLSSLPGSVWTAELQRTYERPWKMLGDAYEQRGQPDAAARCRARAGGERR